MCGMTSDKALIKDLFGKHVTILSIYFFTHIKSLVKNLPYSSKIIADLILNNHTLCPFFYTSFLSKEKIQDIYNSAKEGKRQNIIIKMEITGNHMEMNKYLKFCLNCFKEDMEKLC